MKTKTLILMDLLAVVLAGCDVTQDVLVPALPEVYWDYFPYEVGDSIVFSNGTEEMAFEVDEKHIDKEERIETIVKEIVYARMSFGTKTNDSLLSFGGSIKVPSSLEEAHFGIGFQERGKEIEEWKRGYSFGTTSTGSPTELYFNSPHLSLPWGKWSLEESSFYIDDIVLIKGEGIRSFYNSRKKETWVLKEIIRHNSLAN